MYGLFSDERVKIINIKVYTGLDLTKQPMFQKTTLIQIFDEGRNICMRSWTDNYAIAIMEELKHLCFFFSLNQYLCKLHNSIGEKTILI